MQTINFRRILLNRLIGLFAERNGYYECRSQLNAVPMEGLEPPHLAVQVPKTCASASSATSAPASIIAHICYNYAVNIITKKTPYTKDEIVKMSENFDGVYVKTVIDIAQKICSGGCDRHYDSEQILLEQGSRQDDLWGGGIDLTSMTLDANSFINIRPRDGNFTNEITIESIRTIFYNHMKYFFTLP